ncbi:MAG: hypothetical protein BMS9Abin39_0092 [Ignavibacteria bacterium]|nr:MAG: hypothetical protein BMS9Abin39_0092 [Ignavibacteria bacterium]
MLRRIATIFVVILLLPVFVSAQEYTVLKPDGKITKKYGKLYTVDAKRIIKDKSGNQGNQNVNSSISNVVLSPNGTIDTLIYDPPWDTNFRFNSQDVMLQWFVAPADLTLKFAGFTTNANAGSDQVELKIVRVNWSEADLKNAGTAHHGWYEATGNGFNDITAFMDNPDITGSWVSQDGGLPEPFGNDAWSDGGVGFPIVPDPTGQETGFQWVDMNLLGEPTFLQGEIFGIAIRNLGPVLEGSPVVFWASGVPSAVGAWKFYGNGRTSNDLTTAGWWSREFVWQWAAIVDLTGDRAPVINSFTNFSSGPDPGPFTVDANITDDNPSGGSAGVTSATLWWSNDDGTTWNPVAMTGAEPNYSGDIPAQSPGVDVLYWIEATDVASLTSSTVTRTFFVFGSSGASTLVVFNGMDGVVGYPQEFYWGSGDWPNSFETLAFEHDSWSYGALSAVVLDNYTNVIEITTEGPSVINSDAIRAWLEADGTRNYLLIGDEWLGFQSGWVDGPHVAGEFHFDILGINFEYNDIMGGSPESNLPSDVFPVMGSLLGGPIYDVHTQVSADNGWTAPMTYDPVFEIGVANWMDGVDFEADVEIDMMGLSVDGTTQRPIAGHRTLPAGNKIAFFAYDPLSLDSDARAGAEYWWYGFLDTAPQGEVFKWFGVVTAVERENSLLPDEYSISQNYPNPFNPSTTIKFSVPQQTNVVLKVYDILGSEVASLVNETLAAGNYTVNFDASQFASGMYIYKIAAGNFVTTKKMMLLK